MVNKYANTLEHMGFQIIIKDESLYPVKFFDIGALVFYAKMCVWEFPNLSVGTHFDKLCKLQKEVQKDGFTVGHGHRFLLAARKL